MALIPVLIVPLIRLAVPKVNPSTMNPPTPAAISQPLPSLNPLTKSLPLPTKGIKSVPTSSAVAAS